MTSRTTTDHGWTDDDGRQWAVTLTWQGYECVGVAIEAPPDIASRITAVLVRSAPIGAFIKGARQGVALKLGASVGAPAPSGAAGTPRKKPDWHYHRVANVYFWAWARDAAPLEAVTTRFQVSHSTAARWVREARARKILGPAKQGYAGGYPRWIDPEQDVKDSSYTFSHWQKEGAT